MAVAIQMTVKQGKMQTRAYHTAMLTSMANIQTLKQRKATLPPRRLMQVRIQMCVALLRVGNSGVAIAGLTLRLRIPA